MDECKKVQLLLTSRKHLNSLGHIQEFAYSLYELSNKSTVTILFEKTKRRIDEGEIRVLLA